MMRALQFVALVLVTGIVQATNPSHRVDYQGFTVWLDCKEHAAFMFRYNAGHDMGDYPREDNFRLDPSVSYECQPSSTNTFSTKTIPGAPPYHRGHLVAANHLDYSEQAIRESFFMTNILPMTQAVNLGAWGSTEKITECYRDKSELLVLGGAVWGNKRKDKLNDYFVGSHNIRTPEFFWKVIIKGDGETIAWWIPNDETAKAANLDKYLVKPSQIQVKGKIKLPEVPKAWRNKRPRTSWPIPQGCQSG
jgi:endonuclease G, mitochondrial